MIFIFGYGSLIYANGINGRGLHKKYSDSELFPTTLFGYRREWNALDKDSYTYLGLTNDPEGIVNGVIFPLAQNDFDYDEKKFNASESTGTLYNLINVTDKISLKLDDHQVYTEVTIKPSYEGKIPKSYIKMLQEGLKIRGPEFTKEFLETTFKEPKKTTEFNDFLTSLKSKENEKLIESFQKSFNLLF